VTAIIPIDLSAAFDTIDHNILFDVLHSQYGVNGTILPCVDLLLRPRSCRIRVNPTESTRRSLECSVPQGGLLCPWLYLTYVGTLFDVIPPTISVYGFADDHIASQRFRPT